MKKTWLVTGASSGLGKAIAERVIENGDFVIATFRKLAQVEAFNAKYKGRARAVILDLSNPSQIEEVAEGLIATLSKIDVLVNNAGVGFVGAIEEASSEEVRKVFEANFFGTLKLTQAILPSMRKYKSGHIVQISSHAGVKAFAGFGIYNASKFALEGFSEALAQEVEPLGIKVTIVEPGPFRTKFAGPSLIQSDKLIDDYAATAGAFRNKLLSVDGKQEGDPEKAARIIVEKVNDGDGTLRLPLGKVPTITIGMKIDGLRSDLEANRALAESAVF